MIEDIKKYGLAGAIREHFARRAEARKPPLTHDEQIRNAIELIQSCSRELFGPQSEYKAGRYVVKYGDEHYDGERTTFYSVKFNGTMIWCGTCYGTYNPFHGKWLFSGPWVEDMLNSLLVESYFLKDAWASKREAKLLQEQEDLEREEEAARARHQALIEQFNNGV